MTPDVVRYSRCYFQSGELPASQRVVLGCNVAGC